MRSIRMKLALLVPAALMLAGMLAVGPATWQANPGQARKDGLLLISSSEKGDAENVKSLLKKGVYVHAQDGEGRCALVAAAYKNNLEIVDLLIAAGADVNMKDNTLQRAYLISTSEGYTELLKKTLKAGADVHSTDSYNGTGLIRAADRGHVEIIEELLKTRIRVNHVNRMGWTALLEAIILGDGGKRHTEVVRLLVAAGADINLPDKNGTAPLAHAKNKDFADIIKILEGSGTK
jgi:ankyrin repeat protein